MGGILKEMLIEAIPRLLPGESIGKEIVSLQIPEILSDEAIQERLFIKKFNRQNNCNVSNPRIFKGEAIQVLLQEKVEQSNCIISKPRFF